MNPNSIHCGDFKFEWIAPPKRFFTEGKFYTKMDSDSPDHQFINDGKEPLIFLAIERYS